MKIFRMTLGVILVIVGLMALVTPLTPGAWLALIGLELLGFGFLIPKRVRSLWHDSDALERLKKRFSVSGYPPSQSRSPDPVSPRD